MLAINGMPDHIQIMIGSRPSQSVSDLMQDIKGDSSKWINDKRFVTDRFSWREGYGAFSYRKSEAPSIIRYILKQETHHKKRTFLDAYRDLLKEFEIDFDERYIFKPVDIDYHTYEKEP
jgi:putative transposase